MKEENYIAKMESDLNHQIYYLGECFKECKTEEEREKLKVYAETNLKQGAKQDEI